MKNAIAKVAGTDDLTVLRVVGGNTIGRNRFSRPEDDAPKFPPEPESLEELLSFPDALELFRELLARYALRSGVSGIQPKALLAATERTTAVSSGFIVKSWGADFPQLGANEFHCMKAARKAGLATPEFHLSENGGLFVPLRSAGWTVDSSRKNRSIVSIYGPNQEVAVPYCITIRDGAQTSGCSGTAPLRLSDRFDQEAAEEGAERRCRVTG